MANFNFNKVILGGRLTADPELKSTPAGDSVTNFSVAVTRRGQKKEGEKDTDFITVTAWRNTAEFITQYFRKGSGICIVGSLRTRNWTDQQGQKRYATEVVADEAYFVDSKAESGGNAAPAPASQYVPEQYQTQTTPQFAEVADDEQLLF